MSLKLEARRETPAGWSTARRSLAVPLTMLSGCLLFMLLGYNPGTALDIFLVSPLDNAVYGLAELAVKAAPLILIAIGLAIGFRANVWNIGAEGQFTIGAIAGAGVGAGFWGDDGLLDLPADVRGRRCSAACVGGDPGVPQDAASRSARS